MEFISAQTNRFLPKNEFKKLIQTSFSSPPLPLKEIQLQKLWFESWFKNPLLTTEGIPLTIIQTGFWNHSAGPDFTHAAYRDSAGKIQTGAVEIHLEASDWKNHGHHLDERYDSVILHLVWKSSSEPTISRSGAVIPQVELSRFLTVEIEDLNSLFPELPSPSLPLAKPGLCHQSFLKTAEENRWKLIEEVGWLRLLRKSKRLALRQKSVGSTQSLWEALAEGCGYGRNLLPFRALAQRVRAADLIGYSATTRKAILLGVSGFLPQEIHLEKSNSSEKQHEAQSIWEQWWRAQSLWSHSTLPFHAWTLHGVRPWNRPERRIASLARLLPRLRSLKEALQKGVRLHFQRDLAHLHDPFWQSHSTWNSMPQKPSPLLGVERIRDLEINLYWVWQILEKGSSTQSQLLTHRMTPNHKTKLAWARIGGTAEIPPEKQTVLFQQGLIALLQDFCFKDLSNCSQCSFPDWISQQSLQEKPLSSTLRFEDYRAEIKSKIKDLEKEL